MVTNKEIEEARKALFEAISSGMDRTRAVNDAKEKFGELLFEQIERIDKMAEAGEFIDYGKLGKIIIGVVGGDGIGPAITAHAARILAHLLGDEIKAGKVEIREIGDLTLENRIRENAAIPASSLKALRECHVILKGPTTTPNAGDGGPNIESANVAIRKELDLFANVRPVRVPELGIDWTFYRENTEGSYAVGSKGMNVTDDLAIDFCVATTEGSERIIRAAFEFAKKNGKKRVTAVTKANVIKTTDGKFLNLARKISKEYPEITFDDWYVDIMTAKLIDEQRRSQFEVIVLPNLYGDIITDEAAQIQGGVGTAGSANIGKRFAMFEAIHGSAPRMVLEGRDKYADPSSVVSAAAMLLAHIGYNDRSERLKAALDSCAEEKKIVLTGREGGATGAEYAEYIMEKLGAGKKKTAGTAKKPVEAKNETAASAKKPTEVKKESAASAKKPAASKKKPEKN